MKMRFKSLGKILIALVAAVTIGLVAGCSGGPKSSGKIIVGTVSGNAGTSYLDEKGNLTGFEVEVLKEIDRRIPDVEFEYKTFDFPSLFTELGAKKVDLISTNIQYNKDRAQKYLYSKEFTFATYYKVVVPPDNNTIKSLDDLNGKKLALLNGLQLKVVEDYIKEHNLNIELLPAKKTSEVIELLTSGRADAVFVPEFHVSVFTKYQNTPLKAVGPGYVAKGLTPETAGAHLLFDKNNTALRDKVDKALASMRADGTLKNLSLKWFGIDFTQPLKLQ